MTNRQAEEVQESWIAGHLHYHQSFIPVVQGFVHPLIVSLVKDGMIDAFFFVRYSLGGPHIRLRLHVLPGASERALEAMQQAARRFLDVEPSTRSLGEEAILRSNEHILMRDPHETDGSAYPDNSFRVVPFRPEVQRYGGPRLFRASLDFFTLSSIAAIEFLSRHADAPRSAHLLHALRLLLQQALGFAADETELADLLRYGVDSMGEALPKVIAKGDGVVKSQMDAFLELFHQGLSAMQESTPSAGASGLLSMGSRKLSATLGNADRDTRARIGGSQLHMTATRLGLVNAEEVYLSRLLTATLAAAQVRGNSNLSWIRETVPPEQAAHALSALLPPALSLLDELPRRAAPPSS